VHGDLTAADRESLGSLGEDVPNQHLECREPAAHETGWPPNVVTCPSGGSFPESRDARETRRTHRAHAATERLGEHEHVGRHAVALEREETGFAEPGDDLVEDEASPTSIDPEYRCVVLEPIQASARVRSAPAIFELARRSTSRDARLRRGRHRFGRTGVSSARALRLTPTCSCSPRRSWRHALGAFVSSPEHLATLANDPPLGH